MIRREFREGVDNSIRQLMDECEDVDDCLQYADDVCIEFPSVSVEDVKDRIRELYEHE